MKTRFAVILLMLVALIGAAQGILSLPDDLRKSIPAYVLIAATIVVHAGLPAYALIQHSPFGSTMDKADDFPGGTNDPNSKTDPLQYHFNENLGGSMQPAATLAPASFAPSSARVGQISDPQYSAPANLAPQDISQQETE